jgi:hypothetical protein
MKGNLASAFGDASQRKGSPLRSNMPPGRLVSLVAGLVPIGANLSQEYLNKRKEKSRQTL